MIWSVSIKIPFSAISFISILTNTIVEKNLIIRETIKIWNYYYSNMNTQTLRLKTVNELTFVSLALLEWVILIKWFWNGDSQQINELLTSVAWNLEKDI